MNKQSGILYTCILVLTLLLSGCGPEGTPTPVATIAPPQPPAATATKAAAPTVAPTTAPAVPPTATAAKAATPTVAPTTAPAVPPTSTTAAATKPAGTSKDTCLACHGPFDKLVSASADYLWPNGDKQSPHRYVPHVSKDIPECSNCHKPHPLPPTASDIAAMAKPETIWCFTCHHTGTFECGTCHAVEEATVTPKP